MSFARIWAVRCDAKDCTTGHVPPGSVDTIPEGWAYDGSSAHLCPEHAKQDPDA